MLAIVFNAHHDRKPNYDVFKGIKNCNAPSEISSYFAFIIRQKLHNLLLFKINLLDFYPIKFLLADLSLKLKNYLAQFPK